MTGIANIKRSICLGAATTALALIGFTGSASAAGCDLYAAPDGSDGAAGTEAAPLKTAQALVDRLGQGQTGCLRAGTYAADDEVKLATPKITLTSAPGESATLRTRLWVSKDANGAAVRDLLLDGRNSKDLPSPTVNGDDVTFSGNEVTNHHTAICFLLGSSDGWGVAHRTLIEDNRIHDCGVLPANNHEHGIYVSVSRGAVIRDNWIYDNADRGVQLYKDAEGTLVTGNVIDGNGEGVIFGGSADYASSGNVVERNVITNSQIRHNIESNWAGPVGTDNVARNNCIGGGVEDDGDGGLKTSAGGFTATSNRIAKPRFVDRANGDLSLKPGTVCAEILTGSDAGTSQSQPSGTDSKGGHARRIKAKVNRRRVRAGKRVKVKGRAFGAKKVKLLRKRHGHWRRVRKVRTKAGHRFKVKVRVRRHGGRKRKFRVVARGLRPSKPLRVRVR